MKEKLLFWFAAVVTVLLGLPAAAAALLLFGANPLCLAGTGLVAGAHPARLWWMLPAADGVFCLGGQTALGMPPADLEFYVGLYTLVGLAALVLAVRHSHPGKT